MVGTMYHWAAESQEYCLNSDILDFFFYKSHGICDIQQGRLIWAAAQQNQQNGMCAQWRLRSAWASAQSDQSLCCPHEERLGP